MDHNNPGAPLSTPVPPGLPPVRPPAASAFLQLFIVPSIIVLVLVGLFLLGPVVYDWAGRLLGRTPGDRRSADQFVRDIDNPNPEVRWRAASDLAQVLLRNDELARNPGFALTLAGRLQETLDSSAAAEKTYADKEPKLSPEERAREVKKLEADRNYVIYLSAALGNCMLPVGVPVLKRMATQEGGMEPDALAERRRRALFALATLGENLKRFDRLSDEEKEVVLAGLTAQSEQGNSSSLADSTRSYLEARRRGTPSTEGVAGVLEKCAADHDPSLRFLAAFASNFWNGTATENAGLEEMLAKLANDSGEGEDELDEQLKKNPDSVASREIVKRKGFRVQVNATIALARRGSPKVRLPLLEEMLDEAKLGTLFVRKAKGENEKPNDALVTLTLTDTLKAVAQLHRQRPELDLSALGPAVETLSKHANPAIRVEAEQTLLALKDGSQ
jgi:hypothetical protein